MQIMISGQHFELSDRIKTHVESRAHKLERFYDPIVDCQVKISEEKLKKADLIVNVHKHLLKASADAESVYVAIDQAMDRMERQLKKLHDKQRRKRPAEIQVASE